MNTGPYVKFDKYAVYQSPPSPTGAWVIGGNFHVHVTERPNWIHRYFTSLLLGWQWIDHGDF